MGKIFNILVITFILAITPAVAAVNREIIAAKDGVFMVVSTQPQGGNVPVKKDDAVRLGTGFIIGPNKILTNYHVLGSNPTKIELAMEDMEYIYTAKVLAYDQGSDVAVLQLDDWNSFILNHPNWRVLEWAPNAPELTEDVYVIGHPWGMAYSVSKGIVSMAISPPENAIPRWMIQTDAHVYEGNSGGPLLDDQGRVLGMNTSMRVDTGGSYGFAIPNKLLLKMLDDLDRYGQVRWTTIGIDISGPEHEIKAIAQDGAAAKAGLLVGDKLEWFSVDSNTDHDEKVDSLNWIIWRLSMQKYTDPIWLVVNRQGSQLRLKVIPSYRTSDQYIQPQTVIKSQPNTK